MARIIGGVTSSHIPAVGNAIANNLQQEPYWKRFFDGYEPVHALVAESGGELLGLTHYLFHRSTTSIEVPFPGDERSEKRP